MPIYEYICCACNERFSLLQKMDPAKNATFCPSCSSGNVKKVMSAFCCSSASGPGYSSSMPSSGHGGGG